MMMEEMLLLLKGLPNELITVIIAALPVFELRGAIPIGLLTLKEPFFKVFFLAILGNLIPVIPLLLFLNPLSEKLRHFSIFRRFFDYLFERTRKKAVLVEKYEAFGLALFVAVPLPVTGAWTGCIAASLFKVRFRYAFFAISLGVVAAAVIVSFVTIGGQGLFFHLFLKQ